MYTAAHRGHAAIVELLLTNGANTEAADRLGATPLHKAAAEGHAEVIDKLLAGGADPKAKALDGTSPLDVAHKSVKRRLKQACQSDCVLF